HPRAFGRVVSGLSEKGLPPQVLLNPPVRCGYCDADRIEEWSSDSKVDGGVAVAYFGPADSNAVADFSPTDGFSGGVSDSAGEVMLNGSDDAADGCDVGGG
ncbi:tetratricopeptide repeat (TPR)-containing protein, partial [Striga asiatica]